jgi:hypothetical protein
MSTPRKSEPQTPEAPALTVRALVIGALAVLVGVLTWRYPTMTGPVTAALATFIILDRLTS